MTTFNTKRLRVENIPKARGRREWIHCYDTFSLRHHRIDSVTPRVCYTFGSGGFGGNGSGGGLGDGTGFGVGGTGIGSGVGGRLSGIVD